MFFFDANGYPSGSEPELALNSLLNRRYLLEHDQECRQVQLPTWMVDCHSQILRHPSKVFNIRVGVPFSAHLITKNIKPTALEVQLRMGQMGWELKSDRRTMSVLSESEPLFCCFLLFKEKLQAMGKERNKHKRNQESE